MGQLCNLGSDFCEKSCMRKSCRKPWQKSPSHTSLMGPLTRELCLSLSPYLCSVSGPCFWVCCVWLYIFLNLTLTCWLGFLAWPGTSLILMDLLGDHWSMCYHRYTYPAHLAQVLARPWLLFPVTPSLASCFPVLPLLCCALVPERSGFLGVELSSHGYFSRHAAFHTEISNTCARSQIPLGQIDQGHAGADQYNWLLICEHFLDHLLKLCSTGSAALLEAYAAGSLPPKLGFWEQLFFPLCV